MEKHLHIISFDVPYPVNYGGACDVFYKLVALHQQGIRIHLHCFEYGRDEQPVLNQYCASVQYYKRAIGHKGFSAKLPYIVSSRINESLFSNLLKDDYPILMEGIHCSYLLHDSRFAHRRCFVRLHNVEYRYYRELFRSSSHIIRKAYYWIESRLLRSYEQLTASRAMFLGLNEADNEIYRRELGCNHTRELPLFIPPWKLECQDGMGSYCFYHGDLNVDANEKAAFWLLDKVFSQLEIPLVLAGKNPSKKLIEKAHANNYTCLVPNPSEKEMQDMIAKAHIHVLPSYTQTGMKVKLLNALYNGRHCVVNQATIYGTGLESLCHMAETAAEFTKQIRELYHQPFTKDAVLHRQELLLQRFNNEKNALELIRLIWGNEPATTGSD
ncbi:MAG: glycosyltransferase [Sediminibacterium sp.]|nr:glycosyltransferase [Sediminibacterium sp.]